MEGRSRIAPIAPMLAAALLLAMGLVGGLARMGWDIPTPDLALVHGPLMVSGFFGTVIGIERAVALGRPWPFAAPILTALGGLLMAAGWPTAGAGLMALGSGLFALVAAYVVKRQPVLFTSVMAVGAMAWAGGSVLWAFGAPVFAVVPLWAAFLVLTIAGERLELSRFLPPWPGREALVVVPLGFLAVGAILAAVQFGPAWVLFGLGLVSLTVWSLASDIARRTVRQSGLTRYVAIAILSGYVWLAVAGVIALMPDMEAGGMHWDASLHALFVGYVFAMVFGHVPVILPAVAGVKVPFRTILYLPLALLHISLALRVVGDLMEEFTLRAWGGMLGAVTIAIFIVTVAGLSLAGRRPAQSS